MTPVPDGAVTISPDGRMVTLVMKDIAVIDQPGWPSPTAPVAPARLSYKIIWQATDEEQEFRDPAKHFRVAGHRASARMEASVEVRSKNFSWKSDPMSSSHANFVVMGQEWNGRYYDEEQTP